MCINDDVKNNRYSYAELLQQFSRDRYLDLAFFHEMELKYQSLPTYTHTHVHDQVVQIP